LLRSLRHILKPYFTLFCHRYVADMNKCFSTMYFVLFLTSSLLICLLGFQVTVVSFKKNDDDDTNNNQHCFIYYLAMLRTEWTEPQNIP
jgi:hypothetical protein